MPDDAPAHAQAADERWITGVVGTLLVVEWALLLTWLFWS